MADYNRLRTPFLNLSFTPDVPSNALGPNEYDYGKNIETDVRGIKNVAGEAAIFGAITGDIIYVDSGFLSGINYVYMVATSQGKWYMVTTSGITNITPGYGANPSAALSGYADGIKFTASWVEIGRAHV